MKQYLLATVFVMASASAFAACNEQQLSEKAMAVASKLEALTTKNPKAAEEISTRMMTAQSDPKALTDVSAMCKSYDDTLADLAKAK